jgi:hypothetical protein
MVEGWSKCRGKGEGRAKEGRVKNDWITTEKRESTYKNQYNNQLKNDNYGKQSTRIENQRTAERERNNDI